MSVLARLRNSARPLARFGCVSIGTVYAMLGTLALIALTGRLIEVADEDRMIHLLMDVPGGPLLIWSLVIGMAGYVVWRAVEVATDPYDFGTGAKGLAIRSLIGLSALAYGLLAFSTARIAITHEPGVPNLQRDGAEEQQQRLVAQVLEWPGGIWVVAATGMALIAVGLGQFVVLVRRGYTTEVDLAERSRGMQRTIHALAWYGYSARGVIVSVLGYFLLRAAIQRDPEEAGDTDTAFDFIGGGLIGDSAFFVVALGTIAYGVFMYLNARFYRFGGERPAAGPRAGTLWNDKPSAGPAPRK
ncbi:MAG TPA: DUF1206 domain-containing protein [Vicinamibacterales bacterium]|nr:DUF1206 domain-containing protein [Vicinamibacterales bacterium]